MIKHCIDCEKEKICKLFKNGASLRKVSKIFNCTEYFITKILIEILGLKKYKKIAKEHSIENCQKIGLKYGKETG